MGPAPSLGPLDAHRGAPKKKPDSDVPAPWTSFELGQSISDEAAAVINPGAAAAANNPGGAAAADTSGSAAADTSGAAAAAVNPEVPEDTSRGKPHAKSSGARSSGSAAANPDTIEIDGVHVSTSGVPRVHTEETVEEHYHLSEEEA